jgi:hypothetical protein
MRARDLGAEKIRRLDSAAEQHYSERPVILPRGPKKALDLRMGRVHLLGPPTRRRVVCLGRDDELARGNAKSAQGDFAQIEELKICLKEERGAGMPSSLLASTYLKPARYGTSRKTLSIKAPRGVVVAYKVGITIPDGLKIGLNRALPLGLGLN